MKRISFAGFTRRLAQPSAQSLWICSVLAALLLAGAARGGSDAAPGVAGDDWLSRVQRAIAEKE